MSGATSLQLKAHALAWLRFGKRMSVVCTEVGKWNADVMGLSQTEAIEIEAKASIADLRREFTTKIAKHWLYGNAKPTSSVPNKFYFIVPSTLVEAALGIIEEKAPLAGLLSLNVETVGQFDSVSVPKRAKILRTGPPSKAMVRSALLRSSSELTGLYMFNVEFLRNISSQVDKGLDSVLRVSNRVSGAIEDPEDTERRAREMAYAVSGTGAEEWAALDKDTRAKWAIASSRLLEIQQQGGFDESCLY